MRIGTLLIDMGGVVLEMGNVAGLPTGRADWRGREALLAVFRERGAALTLDDLERRLFGPWREEYERRYALGREARWEEHLKRLRQGTGVRVRDLALLETWFRPYGEQLAPMPGAPAALAALSRRGVRIAMVSNVPLPGALYRRVLARLRLARRFDSFHFSYDAGSRKPSPAMLREALAAVEGVPSEALMVGDRRSSDVAAGRTAGVRTVWVRRDDSGGPAADWEIDSLAELPALVDRLRAE